MSIGIQADACVGAGQCALVAPNVFDQDENGIVMLLEPDPQGPEFDAAVRAARLCPARAIALSAA